MLEQTAKSRDEKTQEIITSSFVDVAHRIRSGVSPNLAVVQVLSETLETLQNNSLTLPSSDYTLWGNALSIFAKEQAQVQHKPQSVMPLKKQAELSQVVLGHNIDTDKDILITDTERTSGMHVIGGTGVGKSTLLTGVFLGDIANGHGGMFIDVDGDSINALLPHIPKERMQDVILLDLGVVDKRRGVQPHDRFIGLNPLAEANIDWVMEVFKNIWKIGSETPRLELTLRSSLLTLAYNHKTIAEMPLLLRDKDFRDACISNIPSSLSGDWVRWFWEQDFHRRYLQQQLEYADSTLNKIMHLLIIPDIAYVISQSKTTFDLRRWMDENKIILLCIPTSTRKLGKEGVQFLGTFILAELKDALLSRADVESSERSFFSLCADEWQLYLTPDFKDMLTRGRKYGLQATIANQSLSQLREVDKELEGITQQVNIHVTFRVGADDADTLAPYYAREPKPEYKEQEKKLPVSNPFDWLVSGHTHTNEVVNRFADGTLRKIHTALSSEYAKEIRAEFNSFLYRAMTSSDALSLLCEKSSLSFLLRLNDLYPIATYYFGQTVVCQPDDVVTKTFSTSKLVSYPVHRGRYSYSASGTALESIHDMPTLQVETYKDGELDERTANALFAMIQAVDENHFNQASAQYAKLAEAKFRKRIAAYLAAYEPAYKNNGSSIRIYFEYLFLPPEQEPAKWDNELQRWMTEERAAFETFIREFRDFILALAKEPILSSSGIYEMVEVGRRTVADMENEMAHELINLPNKKAYVAIGSKGERYKPLMKTKPLPYTKQAESLLQIHKTQAIENAKQYTTEASLIEQEIQARRRRSGVTPTPVASVTAKEERKQPALPTTPHAIVSIPEETTPDTYLELLYYFSNLTLKQAVIKLAGLNGQTNDEQVKINKREQSKMNRLIADGYVETVPSEETSFLIAGGRAPLVYRLKKKGYDKLQTEKGLKPINQGGFSPHAYKVNEVLCAIVQGVKETSYTLVDFTHEKQFRQQPIAVGNQGLEPDSWLCFQVDSQLQSFFLEVDLRSEGSGKLKYKIDRYLQAIKRKAHQGFTAHTVRIVFINPNGKETDTDRLVRIIEETIEPADAAYFLVASVTIDEIAPLDLMTAAMYSKPFDKTLSPLLSR